MPGGFVVAAGGVGSGRVPLDVACRSMLQDMSAADLVRYDWTSPRPVSVTWKGRRELARYLVASGRRRTAEHLLGGAVVVEAEGLLR